MSAIDHRALDRAGARFVYVLGALTREAASGKVPGPGLTQVNEAAWRLVELVGAARIVVDANGAFVNNHRVHVPEGLRLMRKVLAEAFSGRGVGGVSIHGVPKCRSGPPSPGSCSPPRGPVQTPACRSTPCWATAPSASLPSPAMPSRSSTTAT